MKREDLEPRLVHLIAGLRLHQVQEAVRLLLDYIDTPTCLTNVAADQSQHTQEQIDAAESLPKLMRFAGVVYTILPDEHDHKYMALPGTLSVIVAKGRIAGRDDGVALPPTADFLARLEATAEAPQQRLAT